MTKTFVLDAPSAQALAHAAAVIEGKMSFVRLNYRRTIDSRAVFAEVRGDELSARSVEEQLRREGLLYDLSAGEGAVLVEARGEMAYADMLRALDQLSLDASMIDLADGKIMLALAACLDELLGRLSARTGLDFVRRDYDQTAMHLSADGYYAAYIGQIARWLSLTMPEREELLISVNNMVECMENFEKQPAQVLASMGAYARDLAHYHGDAFATRTSTFQSGAGARVHLIEPPCGCNLCLIESADAVIMVDSGFACYRSETEAIIRRLIPDFEGRKKKMLLTHADMDHCGFAGVADEVFMSRKCWDNFEAEGRGEPNMREELPLQQPYERVIKLLSGYQPPKMENLRVIGGSVERTHEPLTLIGTVQIGDFCFEAYEGMGGHIYGECLFIERRHNLAITGDIFVNVKALTPEQRAFNALAPAMISAVDTQPRASAQEREALFALLGDGDWQIIPGHGGVKKWNAND